MAEPWFLAAKAVALPPAWLWFRWRFEHLERIPARGAALIACNHASYLDPIANAYAVVKAGRRPRFLAKDELFDDPDRGPSARRGGADPGAAAAAATARRWRRAERALAAGEVVLVYPEGTVTTRPDGLPDGRQDRDRSARAHARRADHPDGELGLGARLAEDRSRLVEAGSAGLGHRGRADPPGERSRRAP